MSGTRYEQVFDGEWVRPWPQKGHRSACCDCGLVHSFDFRIAKEDGRQYVEWRVYRLNKPTAARRKRLGIKVKSA